MNPDCEYWNRSSGVCVQQVCGLTRRPSGAEVESEPRHCITTTGYSCIAAAAEL